MSRSAVQHAKAVLEKGSPDLAAKVDRGEVTVSAAAKSLRENDDRRAGVEDAPQPCPSVGPLAEEQRRTLIAKRATLIMWERELKAAGMGLARQGR